ncbi:hypothetical protein C7960_2154 [Methanohalophilus euhalobius]|uniref:Uncharacterized protein n=1 Tax=Methanohalophilus euhalobius TaxID=51203 RepID=A0A483E0E6_9EURY|nr:hypothetical protein C7960_2154 [Methanohalophilus euhalobius]
MGTQSFNKPEDKIKKVRRAYKKAADFWEYEDKIETGPTCM